MGLSSKKSKQTTNQQTTATVTPTNPGFTTDAIGGLAGRTEDYFKGLDPYSLVPGADPLQTQAGQGAGGLTTSPNFGQASDILTGVAGAGPQHVGEQNIADYLQRFQDPYTNDVVNTTLAGFDQSAGRTRAQQQLDLAGDTTFGGSGGSILRSLTEGELGRGRASTEAQIRDQGFQTALGAATSQAGFNQQTGLANAGLGEQALSRQAGAATSLADVGAAGNADTRANIGLQGGIGDLLRQIKAAQAGAPITALGANADILGKTPFDLLKGSNATGSLSGTSNTTTSGAGLSDWVKLAQAAATAAAASDLNLKTDIETIGHDEKGRRWVSWRWKWDEPDASRKTGVIAQEVRETDPEAVFMHPAGFLMVDYPKLLEG